MATRQQENVAVVRKAYEAFNERDMETIASIFDEDLKWFEPAGWRYGGCYLSSEAVAEDLFGRILADVEDFQAIPERFVDAGETVVVRGIFEGTVNETGKQFEVPFVQIVDLTDGKISRLEDCHDTASLMERFEA